MSEQAETIAFEDPTDVFYSNSEFNNKKEPKTKMERTLMKIKGYQGAKRNNLARGRKDNTAQKNIIMVHSRGIRKLLKIFPTKKIKTQKISNIKQALIN